MTQSPAYHVREEFYHFLPEPILYVDSRCIFVFGAVLWNIAQRGIHFPERKNPQNGKNKIYAKDLCCHGNLDIKISHNRSRYLGPLFRLIFLSKIPGQQHFRVWSPGC